MTESWIPSVSESERLSVVSDSFRPHGLYDPWSSPGQNTGVGSLRIEPRSPALQADSLPAEPQGKNRAWKIDAQQNFLTCALKRYSFLLVAG